jgi:hypothetical protein
MADVETKPKAEKRATAPAKTGSTVTVACKVPNGVVLQLCQKVEWDEETPSGSRKRVRYDKTGETFVVRGPAVPYGNPNVAATPLVGGYALTPGVPEDFWKAWLEQNKTTDMVTSGMIFAHGKVADTRAEAREKKDLRSGLEPLVPDTDRRMPRSVSGGVTGVSTAEEQQAKIQAAEDAEAA